MKTEKDGSSYNNSGLTIGTESPRPDPTPTNVAVIEKQDSAQLVPVDVNFKKNQSMNELPSEDKLSPLVKPVAVPETKPDIEMENKTGDEPTPGFKVPLPVKKREGKHGPAPQLSEISFFYDNNVEEESDEDDEDENSHFILIQAATVQAKMENQCEDAFFITERGFGVSDGVSGWNDYGFSSDQFSLQLMFNCKKLIDKAISNAIKQNRLGNTTKPKKLRRNQKSYLSMDNLDIEEESDEDDRSDQDGQSGLLSEDGISSNNSRRSASMNDENMQD